MKTAIQIENELIGKKFERLTIIGQYQSKNKQNNTAATIMCACECGINKRISVNALRQGHTKSCGCLGQETRSKNGKKNGQINGLKIRKYPPEEASARELFSRYKKRSPGTLLFEKFFELIKLPCYYCNKSPNQKYNLFTYGKARKLIKSDFGRINGTIIYNGLDRIDNLKGYDTENVITCCKTCNFMRHILSMDEFYQQIICIMKNHPEELSKINLQLISKINDEESK